MKKIILFIASLYLLLIFNFAFFGMIDLNVSEKGVMSGILKIVFFIFWGALAVATAILSILILIYAAKDFLKKDIAVIRKYMITIKLSAIPFFILNFIYFYMVFFIFFVATRGLIIIFISVPVVLTFFILLVTSAYSIIFILRLYKYKAIGLSGAVFNLIIQLIFVLDIFGVLYLMIKYPKKFCRNLTAKQ